MSKKEKSPTNQSLAGTRVLVGRARHQAGALSTELQKLGATVIEIPFIEIRKPSSFKPLDTALKNLDTYDWLILTSVNGVEAMWDRMQKLHLAQTFTNEEEQDREELRRERHDREGHDFSRAAEREKKNAASAAEGHKFRVAAIGPATKKAIEQRGIHVAVVPKEYVAESVVRSLKGKVKGNRVLLVRAKVARDVIPLELRKAGAHVDVVEAYETVVPRTSRARLCAALKNPGKRPQVVTFTSSSTVKNFVELLGAKSAKNRSSLLNGIRMASIGPVTSATLRDLGLAVDIAAKEFTIPGLIKAITKSVAETR